jgi:uncharacterized phage infection (PIP) family protein YhgE
VELSNDACITEMEETMQPDLLSAEKDENAPQETSSDALPVTENVQVESAPVVEETPVTPIQIPEKKRSKVRLASIVLGILVFLFFVAFAWVGYWTYQLNTQLTDTQQQLSALKAEHEKLQSDYQTLSSEKDQLNKDLEKSNADLATAQSDLSKSKQKSSDLTQKMDKASKLVDVLHAWLTSDEASDVFEINALIDKSGNQDLINEWSKLMKSPSDEAFGNFVEYLATATRDSLK